MAITVSHEGSPKSSKSLGSKHTPQPPGLAIWSSGPGTLETLTWWGNMDDLGVTLL